MASAARETASNWLRESKTETQGHGPAFDRLPQFRALLERFPDVAGEALSTIFGAAASGLAFAGVAAMSGRRLTATTALPFGPFLALAAWMAWLYGGALETWLEFPGGF